MSLPKHLGGHLNKTHLDEGSLNFLIDKFHVKSFLDVGCGPGGMVELASQKGLKSLGIDGDYSLERYDQNKFILHDYSTSPLILNESYDLCWSVEFVEHVEEKFVDNFMATINSCKICLITHALPGTPGHHHVNCQLADYWINVFKKYDFNFNEDITKTIKKVSTMKKPFVQKNGLFFQKAK